MEYEGLDNVGRHHIYTFDTPLSVSTVYDKLHYRSAVKLFQTKYEL
jgi:hypothetical protein